MQNLGKTETIVKQNVSNGIPIDKYTHVFVEGMGRIRKAPRLHFPQLRDGAGDWVTVASLYAFDEIIEGHLRGCIPSTRYKMDADALALRLSPRGRWIVLDCDRHNGESVEAYQELLRDTAERFRRGVH